MSPFGLRIASEGVWRLANQALGVDFILKAYRKVPLRRPPFGSTSSSESSFFSISPMESARAAIESGSYEMKDSAPTLADLKDITERAGRLVRDVLTNFMQHAVEHSRAEGKAPDLQYKEVQRRIQQENAFMGYRESIDPNRAYMRNYSDMREAKEELKVSCRMKYLNGQTLIPLTQHAKAQPDISEGATVKVVVSAEEKGRFFPKVMLAVVPPLHTCFIILQSIH